jgi:hypothetical protein
VSGRSRYDTSMSLAWPLQHGRVPARSSSGKRGGPKQEGNRRRDPENCRKAAEKIRTQGQKRRPDGHAADKNRVGEASDGPVVQAAEVAGVHVSENGLVHSLRYP